MSYGISFVSIGPGELENGRLKVCRGCEHPELGLLLRVGRVEKIADL